MLSAFTARPIVELRSRDRSKIESILAYGDRLLVGLNTGSLRVYRVNEQHGAEGQGNKGDPKAKPTDLLREVEKFSPRSIEQLARLKEANALIILSNYHVSIYDINTYVLQEQLARTKNATTFALTSNIAKDPDTGIPEIISRLAVVVKRRLLLWTWQESELSSAVVEITLSEPIRTLTWASATKIICGLNSGYVIVDVDSQACEDIVGPGAIGGAASTQGSRFGGMGSASMGYIGLGSYIPRPLATKLAEGEILLAKDINSLFISPDAQPLEKRQIPWQSAPEVLGYSYPYITALQSPAKSTLEVRNPDTLSLMQTISLPNANQMHFPPSNVSLAHAGKGFHVASDRCVWRMEATNYDAQIASLVEKERFDEAISILNMLEDALLSDKSGSLGKLEGLKRKKLFDGEMAKAQVLFANRKYRDAVDIFIDIEAPPESVIKLYPKIIAGELSIIEESHNDSGVDTNDHDGADGSDNSVNVPSSEVRGATPSLRSATKASTDSSSLRSLPKGDDTAEASAAKSLADPPLQGKDLNIAALELNAFLVGTRNCMKKVFDVETGTLKRSDSGQNGSIDATFDSLLRGPASTSASERQEQLLEMAKLVDTTLFRSYMLSNPSLAGSLFRIPNLCDPDVVKQKLLETGRVNYLVDFFHGKRLHRPALEMLRKFGTMDESKDCPQQLRGPRRTVGYLQNLPAELVDLVIEFAEWPLKTDPVLGMEIFLADTENAESLPRDRIVRFLHGLDVRLEIKYLEHIINDLDDLTPGFHERLVTAFIEDLRSRKERESEDWSASMQHLLAFLRSSKQYPLMKTFNFISKDDPGFYEAQAIVLSNMGEHRQALSIYVFKLQDYVKAEEYCNVTHLHGEDFPAPSRRASTSAPDDALPSIYHTLLSLYLTPPPPHEQNWPPALSLLSKHGSRLPADQTLNLIPDTLPVAELESYFRGRIRSANSIVNESQVVVGLRKTEVVAAQAALLLGQGGDELAMSSNSSAAAGRSRRVMISEDRVCWVCHKRLGGSVIAVLQDNSVVHYGCLGKAKQQSGGNAGLARRISGSVGRIRSQGW